MALLRESGTVASDGEEIYWELVNEGPDDERPVVVLSHGAGGTHAIWYQQVPALGRNFRVVTWDSRGFGNSSNRNEAPSPEAAAGDLAAVLDSLNIDKIHLVGQSMGGWHNSAFALANPERLLSLVYADTVGGMWTEPLREAFAEFQSRGGLTPDKRDADGTDSNAARADGPPRLEAHRALWSGTAERDPAHAFLYEALGSFHSPPMRSLGATIQWGVTHEQIAAIGVPVLFVAGTHDEIFPAPLLAESSTRIPEARYVEIPASGHSPYFEQPDAWNDAVERFLLSV